MALKEDYKDAVFAGLRKYKMLDNGDGTVSPVDMTKYENGGDKFGAKDVNAITKTVNATGEIIADDNDGFKPDQKYVIGDIVIYDNKTWRFKVDHEPGEWDESQVERTNILAVIAEQNKNFAELNKKMQNISFGFSTNTIKTISSRTETYTAVQDCWCVGRIKGGSADPCGIILDDVLLFNLDATSYVPVVIPIKKGQKISIKGNATLCSLNFYESL